MIQIEIANIDKKGFFSLILDESGDTSKRKVLIIIARYEEDFEYHERIVHTCFLENTESETIYHAVDNFLKTTTLELKKIVSIATDGARYMLGSKSGLVKLLRKKIPALKSIHCLAHRNSLIASDLKKHDKEIEDIFLGIFKLTKFFNKSTNNKLAL